MSGSYERVNYITSFGFSLRWRQQFLKHLPASNEPVKIIDLMTGMGETWGAVKSKYPNSEFSALDFSEGMLRQAGVKNTRSFGNNVQLLNQNVLENELPSDHYDIVISAFGLKTFNSEQMQQLAKETKRILKPGGYFSFIEVSRPSSPVLHSLYKLHLKHVVPVCGKILLGNPVEYRQLWKYTDAYKNSDTVAVIFRETGLEVSSHDYFYGCATGISGRKKG